MKTQEQLELVLSKKKAELVAVQTRIEELNVWIGANNVFKDNTTTFLEKLFTEKAEEYRQFERINAQVDLLKWCLE